MASFCDAQARAEVQDPSKLEWSVRLPYGRPVDLDSHPSGEREGVHSTNSDRRLTA
jgi:hypothetical protein